MSLEPLIKTQNLTERRVNNQFSELETQIAALSQVFNQNGTKQHCQCDICGSTVQNQRSLHQHRRTNHLPQST